MIALIIRRIVIVTIVIATTAVTTSVIVIAISAAVPNLLHVRAPNVVIRPVTINVVLMIAVDVVKRHAKRK